MKIPCAIYRGGTSKPVFFLEDDLPKDAKKRDAVVLDAFGTPDVRQIDGLDNANPVIDYTGNCGNTSAAVEPLAALRGLINPTEGVTKVRIYNTNTKKVQPSNPPTVRIGHPTGKLQVEIELEEQNGQQESP